MLGFDLEGDDEFVVSTLDALRLHYLDVIYGEGILHALVDVSAVVTDLDPIHEFILVMADALDDRAGRRRRQSSSTLWSEFDHAHSCYLSVALASALVAAYAALWLTGPAPLERHTGSTPLARTLSSKLMPS